jgi:stearoyl-CoA desaturase (delta-9 desaturase)
MAMISRNIIFILQLLSYASLIPMILFGHWWHWIVAFFMYFLFNGLGMIMTYHRLLSHRVFTCPRWFEYLMTFITTFTFTGSAITWVAIHRKHHKYSDTNKDPHSPDHLGRWKVHFCTVFAPVEGKYAVDLMRDKFYLWQHKNYLTIILVGLFLASMIDFMFVIYFILFPAGLTLLFGTFILSICHHNFKPRTLKWLSLLTFGDAFHDIHHESPGAHRLHKYDFVGWLIEKIFKNDKSLHLE